MYFSDAVRVLLRRWLVVALGLAITVGAGAAAVLSVDTRYQASGQVVLLPPSKPAVEGEPINPYLNLPAALSFSASLIASAVTSLDSVQELQAAGFESSFAASVVPGTGPLIVITVEDIDPAAAISTRDEVIRSIEQDLVQIQERENVPADQYIVARPFAVPPEAEVLAGARIRALGIIMVLGVVATALAAFGIDRVQERRRQRRIESARRDGDESQNHRAARTESDAQDLDGQLSALDLGLDRSVTSGAPTRDSDDPVWPTAESSPVGADS